MARTLFHIGNIPIPSYNFFLFLAFISFYLVLSYRARKYQITSKNILIIYFIVLFSSTLGARLFYGLFHPDIFKDSWIKAFNIFDHNRSSGIQGFSLSGGLMLALLTLIIYCRIAHISLRKLLDIMVPAFGMGLFFSRLGCFLNGCCFGVSCSLPWKIIFPPSSPAGIKFPETPVHPTQLYEAIGGLAIFAIALWAERKPKPEGFLFIILCWTYAPVRFIIDFFRYDPGHARPTFHTLLFSQYFSIFIFIFGFILLGYLYVEQKKKSLSISSSNDE